MKTIITFILLLFFTFYCADGTEGDFSSQNQEVRNLCKRAQELEQKMSIAENEINTLELQEKNTAPILRNIYGILTRCVTLLFDIQRFSVFLTLGQSKNKNDLVRCSIVIKNFSSYFEMVSSRLKKNTNEIILVKQKKTEKSGELARYNEAYNTVSNKIKKAILFIPRGKEEEIIKNVVYHIATKANSLDELDAELESENAVGVLQNTKVRTKLSLIYPVNGKIVSEFGDKGNDGEMVYYLAFETRQGAVVTSPAKGLVVFSGKFLNYGNMVIISNGDYRIFLYGMSDDICINTGDVVEIGDYIGKMPSNEENVRPIIKMELRKFGEALDPRHWLFETIEKEKNSVVS